MLNKNPGELYRLGPRRPAPTGLQRISQLARDFPQIVELDINPFIVGEIGTEPIVADARMTLQAPESK